MPGRESNFVFCHAKVAGQGYQTNPLPEGLGFGGSLGKERVWLDDNATPGKVTVRHHAVDKTFQPGALVPDLVSAPETGDYGASHVNIRFEERFFLALWILPTCKARCDSH